MVKRDMQPPPKAAKHWKPSVRYGVLVKTDDGYLVCGPRKYRGDAEDMAGTEDSCLTDLGKILGAVKIVNWQWVYEHSYKARGDR